MRRTLATLLVVASPVLMAAPVDADGRPGRPAASQVVAPPTAPVTGVAVPDPVAVPSVPASGAPVQPGAPATRPPATRPPVNSPPAPAAAVDDDAYSARLQAELCLARAVFCGLTDDGRYPAG